MPDCAGCREPAAKTRKNRLKEARKLSLIIALAKSREAVIGGDRRTITFLGAAPCLEEELYSGQIKDDHELKKRAEELGAFLQVSDGKVKVWKRKELLVGEVTEISAGLSRRRRIYLTPGAYLIADIVGDMTKINRQGNVGCVVLGNQYTQKLAYSRVSMAGGRVNAALIESILKEAAESTASVSREHIILKSDVLQADPVEALSMALLEDCKRNGWRQFRS